MLVKKDPPLTDEKRSRRIRELADEAGTSDDPAAFDRAFDKMTTPEQSGVRTGTAEKPKSVNRHLSPLGDRHCHIASKQRL